VAVLAGVVVARTGPHHHDAAASSSTPAAAAGSAPQWWLSPPSPCEPTGDLPLPTGGGEGTVRLWNLATGQPADAPMQATSTLNGVTGVAFSPDDMLLASCGGDGTVRLWNPVNGGDAGQLRRRRAG
jgi:WD40 repeat protein